MELFGREADLEVLDRWVGGPRRHLTLVGPPGIGKTALAVRFAAGKGPRVWVCDLSPVRELGGIGEAVASAGGVSTAGGSDPVERVRRSLARNAPPLVVLDNCEHVTRATAEALGLWMPLAPRTHFLVTSRERLGVEDEAVHELAPLALATDPGELEASAAGALWVARVSNMRSGYRLAEDDVEAVTSILRALDGIPLAIELAASRANVLGSREILARIGDRFALLSGRGSRSLVSTIDLSYESLSTAERRAFAELSVFEGGFGLEAAEAVLVDEPGGPGVLDLVQSLRDKSLVSLHRTAPARGELRLHMYASIREYAASKLASCDEVEDRHAEHFAHAAREWSASGVGDEGEALERIAAEQDNLLAAARRMLLRPPRRTSTERAMDALVALAERCWVHLLLGLRMHDADHDELPQRGNPSRGTPPRRARASSAPPDLYERNRARARARPGRHPARPGRGAGRAAAVRPAPRPFFPSGGKPGAPECADQRFVEHSGAPAPLEIAPFSRLERLERPVLVAPGLMERFASLSLLLPLLACGSSHGPDGAPADGAAPPDAATERDAAATEPDASARDARARRDARVAPDGGPPVPFGARCTLVAETEVATGPGACSRASITETPWGDPALGWIDLARGGQLAVKLDGWVVRSAFGGAQRLVLEGGHAAVQRTGGEVSLWTYGPTDEEEIERLSGVHTLARGHGLLGGTTPRLLTVHTHMEDGFTWSVHLSDLGGGREVRELADERSVAAWDLVLDHAGEPSALYQAGTEVRLTGRGEVPLPEGSRLRAGYADALHGYADDGGVRVLARRYSPEGNEILIARAERTGPWAVDVLLRDDPDPCDPSPEEGDACALDRRTHDTATVLRTARPTFLVHERRDVGSLTYACDFEAIRDIPCLWEGEVESTHRLLVASEEAPGEYRITPVEGLALGDLRGLGAHVDGERAHLAVTDRPPPESDSCRLRHVQLECTPGVR